MSVDINNNAGSKVNRCTSHQRLKKIAAGFNINRQQDSIMKKGIYERESITFTGMRRAVKGIGRK